MVCPTSGQTLPCSTVEAATLFSRGSPPLAPSPVSTCRAPYPGGPVRVPLSAAAPDRAAFPELRAGRCPQLLGRGLLRLHTRCGPSIRSPARGEVCRGASIPSVIGRTACQVPGQPTIAGVGPNAATPLGTHCRATIKVRIPDNQDEKGFVAWAEGRA